MSQANTTLGIYGGTFNPVHLAHLELVKKCLMVFEFDEFNALPSYMSDYKAAPIDATHRLNMLRLSFSDMKQVRIDQREIDREGITYTIDTVREYRAERHEASGIFFIMGSDSWLSFDSWNDWLDILKCVNIIVVSRATSDEDGRIKKSQMSPSLLREYESRICTDVEAFMQSVSGKVFEFSELAMNISSTEIRKNILENKSTNTLLAPNVRRYIDEHQLYQNS